VNNKAKVKVDKKKGLKRKQAGQKISRMPYPKRYWLHNSISREKEQFCSLHQYWVDVEKKEHKWG